jgi:hypothetical protein
MNAQLLGNRPIRQPGLVQRQYRKYLVHLEFIRHPAAPSFPLPRKRKRLPIDDDLSS